VREACGTPGDVGDDRKDPDAKADIEPYSVAVYSIQIADVKLSFRDVGVE
jgi:hypothetical protein